MSEAIINIQQLTVAYQGKLALNEVDVMIQPKKITGIIGPNGAGKSTFMKAILALIPKESGEISFGG